MKRLEVLAAVIGMGLAAAPVASAATAVGNGGDVVERYLEATRYLLVEAATRIDAGQDAQTLCTCADASATDAACQLLKGLDAATQAQCRAVLQTTAAGELTLNSAASPVPLSVSSDPLYVTTNAGGRAEVAASTAAGPAGPVIFSYGKVSAMAPMDLLQLMTRELTEKVAYPSAGTYLGEAQGALLDAVGAGMARYAFEHKLVGTQFQILDNYSCDVQEATTGIDFSSLGASLRMFPAAADKDVYETGVGNQATDLSCALKETSGTQLVYRVKIHEETGCSADGDASRYTQLQVWRVTAAKAPLAPPPDQLLESSTLAGTNPLCASGDQRDAALTLAHAEAIRSYVFSVTYAGSTGRAGPVDSSSTDCDE